MGSRGWGLSGINQVVEETGEKWREGVLFGAEELGLGLAHLAALRRVAVVGVVGDGDVFACLFEFVGQGCGVQPGLLVINEVLQVVGVAAFLGKAQQDDRLGYEDAALWRLGGGVLVDLGVAVVQRLDLLREDGGCFVRSGLSKPAAGRVSSRKFG